MHKAAPVVLSNAAVFGLSLTVLHLAACSAVAITPSVEARTKADLQAARNLAATCAGCHGPEGHSVGGMMASLAGREREEILAILADFRKGRRPATIMHQIVSGYSDVQLQLIAAWYAAQPAAARAPAPPSAQPSPSR